MMRGVRIVPEEFAETAFSGEGAFLVGGRWNSAGVRVVYLAESAALATLEMLVNGDSSWLVGSYLLFEATFDPDMVEELDAADLPSDWRRYPPQKELTRFGDEWAASGRSALLRVPSAVIPTESNFLLNPEHPDFRRIRIDGPRSIEIDQRLLSKRLQGRRR
jgi:RES domain-containing protein